MKHKVLSAFFFWTNLLVQFLRFGRKCIQQVYFLWVTIEKEILEENIDGQQRGEASSDLWITAVDEAVDAHNWKELRELIAQVNKSREHDDHLCGVLCRAVSSRNYDLVRVLCEDASVDPCQTHVTLESSSSSSSSSPSSRLGQSPLQIAYSQYNIQILSTLISALHVLDPDRSDANATSAIKYKPVPTHVTCCDCPSPPTSLPKEVLSAACKGDIVPITAWLAAGNDVNAVCSAPGADCSSMLHGACLYGQTHVITALMEHRLLHLNTKNSRGWTPMICAVYGAFARKENKENVQHSSATCVDSLIENKQKCMVSVLSPNENGDAALKLAVMDGLTDVVQILLKKYKDFSRQHILHALEHLIDQQRWSFVRDFLKKYHCDQKSHTTLRTILKLAIEKENLDTILLMLENDVWEKQLDVGYINEDIKRMLHKSLHGAVRENRSDLVKVLIEKIDLDAEKKYLRYNTSPLEEASRRGHTEILDILNGKLMKINPAEHIEKVLEDIIKREERIFEFIKMKNCLKIEEIKPLLEGENKSQCDIPWTIRDENGASILHYVVSSPFSVDFQYDIQNEITQLVNFKDGPYINAVDFDGKTCIHYLAELKGIHLSSGKIKKDRQEARIISIIELLIKLGANAALQDNSGKLPEELAKLPKTKFFLKEQRLAFTSRQRRLHESEHVEQVLEAASNGEDTQLKEYLLKEQNTLRSQNGYSGPLHIAIAQGNWKTLQLLLGAGAPLSDISNEGFTVLETAYRTENLPARMHALIRNAYIKQLEYEFKKACRNSLLKRGIRQLIKDIRSKGYQAKWPSEPCFRDNFKLLVNAASLGLSITCHLICIDPCTRVCRLPGDKNEHPVCASLMNSQFETARVLCFDHKLHPYYLPMEQENTASKLFYDNLFLEEFERIKNLPISNINCNNKSVIKQISSLIHGQNNVSVDHNVLRFIAENGLLHILHRIIKKSHFDLNEIIDTVSRSGLIHIAARYGHVTLVEYLFLSGAKTNICARGKLTPAHLAALFGHKRCWKYLKCLPGGKELCKSDMEPESLLNGFEEMLNTLKLQSLGEEEKSNIYNNPISRVATQTLLNSKGKSFGIDSTETLLQCAIDRKVNLKDSKNSRVKEAFENVFKSLIDRVGQSDSRFEGDLVPAGSVAEDIRLHLLDELDYNVVLRNFHAMDMGNISIETDQNEKTGLKDIRLIPDVTMKSHDRMLFEGRHLITEFKNAIKNVLSDPSFEFETKNISLVYPGILETRVGIVLHFVWSEKGETSHILLPSVDLVPAIRVPLPSEDTGLMKLPKKTQDMLQCENVCIVCCGENQWRYSLSSFENVLLSNLEIYQRAVILACKLLCSFMKPDWWYPEEYKRFYQVWKKIYLKIDVPVSYVVKAAFTQELADNANPDSWTNATFIKHVISTFERMMDVSGKSKQVQSFFVPSYESHRFGDGADDFLEYLTKLKN